MEAVTIYITFWTAFQYEYSSCQINDYYQVSPPTSEMIVSSPLPSVLISMPFSKKNPVELGQGCAGATEWWWWWLRDGGDGGGGGICAIEPIVPIVAI